MDEKHKDYTLPTLSVNDYIEQIRVEKEGEEFMSIKDAIVIFNMRCNCGDPCVGEKNWRDFNIGDTCYGVSDNISVFQKITMQELITEMVIDTISASSDGGNNIKSTTGYWAKQSRCFKTLHDAQKFVFKERLYLFNDLKLEVKFPD